MKDIVSLSSYNSFSAEWHSLYLGDTSPLAINHTQDRIIARVIKAVLATIELIPMTIPSIVKPDRTLFDETPSTTSSRKSTIFISLCRF